MKSVCCYFFLLLFSSFLQAADGESEYQAKCVACHGANGAGMTALNSPALAGQSVAYLRRQLQNFKTGVRGSHSEDLYGQQMLATVAALSEQQLEALAVYAGALAEVKVAALDGDVQRGEKYYQSYCGSCHGAQAQGNDLLNSPNLRLLDGVYQLRQYQYFLDGVRGGHAQDKFGRQMAMIANGLKDMEIIKDIIAYISQ